MQIRPCLHKIYVLKASSLLYRNHAYIALELSYSIGGYRSDQSEEQLAEAASLQEQLEDIIRAVAVMVYRLWIILLDAHRSESKVWRDAFTRALQKALEDIIRAVAVVVYRLWVILLDAHRTKFKTWKGNFSAAHASAMNLLEQLHGDIDT